MKSLVLCPYLPFPPNHGGRIRSVVLCDALRGLGPVVVAAPVVRDEEQRARSLAAAAGCEFETLGEVTTRTSMSAKIGHWLRGRSELLERRWTTSARTRAAALCLSGGFDVVAADSSFVLPLLPASLRETLILHLHNVESAVLRRSAEQDVASRDRFLRRVEARAIARVESRALRRAALTVAVSEVDARLVRSLAPRATVAVVENSVPLDRLPPLPDAASGDPLLLFVGSFAYPPNRAAARELVLRHLPVLRARWPSLRVRLIGADPDGGLDDLRGQEGLEVHGFAEDLLAHYREATAIYAPIREGGGTRIKVLEAMALRRTVISTVVGVEGLDVQCDRHWLSCETPDDGVRSVARVLAGDARALLDAGRDLVERRHAHGVVIERLRAAIAERFRRA